MSPTPARRRRYRSLAAGELVAATMFAVVAATVAAPWLGASGAAALWSALVPLLLVLGQAAAYWALAARGTRVRPIPPVAAHALRALRWLNLILLATGLAVVLARLPETAGGVALVLGTWAFGVIEYVNYFVVRLAYPASSWFSRVKDLRTPQLWRDVRATLGWSERSGDPWGAGSRQGRP
jgi:hypothetical protein